MIGLESASAATFLNSPVVRVAGPDDAQALLEELYWTYLDDRVGLGLPPSPKRMRPFIEHILTPGQGFVGIIEGDGIEASIGLLVDQHWYSDEWLLLEKWVFVSEKHRGSGHLDKLFDFACGVKAQIEESGQPCHVITSLLTEERLAAKERLWARRGKKIGAIFLLGDKR
jgi:hypothetical protein